MERGAGTIFLIVSLRFHPDRTAMRLQDAAGNGQPQARAAALELCLPTGVQVDASKLPELFKYYRLIIMGDSYTRIADCNFDESLFCLSIDCNRAAIGRVFYRIVDDISDGLHHAGRVNIEPLLATLKVLDLDGELSMLKYVSCFET